MTQNSFIVNSLKKTMELSVVLPVHNEEKNIEFVYKELVDELKRIGKKYEIIFVNDGSTDKSFEKLVSISSKDKHVRVVKLLSNYGQSTALAAGIEQASGDWIVTMDSDGQHDPKDIAGLIEPLPYYHVVAGWRRKRGGLNKSLPNKIANYLVRQMTGLQLRDSVGGMKAFTKQVSELVPLYGDMHRYLPVLAKWKGFRVTERPVSVRRRKSGRTHYKLKRIFGGFFDLMTVKFFVSYSTRLSHFFSVVGFTGLSAGFLIGLYYLIQKFFFGVHLMTEVASLILSVLLILLGVNFICFGFIADMISFDAISSGRKTYVIEKVL